MFVLPSNKVIITTGVVMGLSYMVYKLFIKKNSSDDAVFILS